MLGASGRRRARRKSQFGSCVPAQQDVQASTVAVDEAQIIRLIGRVLIAGLGGIRPLVELLGDERKSAACREAAARTLWNLATNNDLKVSIAAAGAISPLVALMGGANASVGCKEAAAGCLRNLAVTAENAAAIANEGALGALLDLCRKRLSPGCAEAAAGALRNLTCHCPENSAAVASGAASRRSRAF
ncbi:hypothetical protein JL720_16992 [Aureococcus anophagefferens]|nr:hypothetical protein JL720_16992 [Aureococcus anophagefferens]